MSIARSVINSSQKAISDRESSLYYSNYFRNQRAGSTRIALPSSNQMKSGNPFYDNPVTGAVGSVLGPLGFLASHLDELTNMEKTIGYLKSEAGSYAGTFERNFMPWQGVKNISGSIGAFSAGGLKGVEEFQKSEAEKKKKDIKEHGVEDIINVASLIPFSSAAGIAAKGVGTVGKQALKTGGKSLIKSQGEKMPGAFLKTLGRFSPGVSKGISKVSIPIRKALDTGIARGIGKVGEASIASGVTADVASSLKGKETKRTELIPEGNLRTAVQVGMSGVTKVPWAGAVYDAVKLKRSKVFTNVASKELDDGLRDVFTKTELNKTVNTVDGTKVTMGDVLKAHIVRWAGESPRGIPLEHMKKSMVQDFIDEMERSGKWIKGDNKYNLAHFELSLRKGTNLTIKSKDELLHQLKVARGETKTTQTVTMKAKPNAIQGEGFTMTPSSKTYQRKVTVPEAKAGSFIGKTKGPTQAGSVFTPHEVLPKPELDKVGKVVYNLRKDSIGRKFLTKVESGYLIRKSDNAVLDKLVSHYGESGKVLHNKLMKAQENYNRKLVPIQTMEYLSNKMVKEAISGVKGIDPSEAHRVRSLIAEAFDDTLKQEGIFSIKSKIAKQLPTFKQAERLYMGLRFGLKPSFIMMQKPEFSLSGRIAQSELKTKLGKDVAADIMAHTELGKGGKLIAGKEVPEMERTALVMEKAKLAKGRALYFTDELVDNFKNTVVGKKWVESGKKIEDFPMFKKFQTGLEGAKDKVDFINKFIKDKRLTMFEGMVSAEKSGLQYKTMGRQMQEVAFRKAVMDASINAQKRANFIPLYTSFRSPVERMIHPVAFPYSYTKKVVTKGGKALTTGKTFKSKTAYEAVRRFSDLRDRIEEQSDNTPQLKPVVFLMNVFDPIQADFPMSFGGPTPFFRAMERIINNPEYYNPKKVSGANAIVKQLAPAIKEYERYIGFGYNLTGNKEPSFAKYIYPQYREENRKKMQGNIKAFQKYQK